jgi:uncharacterized protein YbjT (DUF2867 family)
MILVTGGTGNVGGEVTRALAARGEAVRVLARKPDQAVFPAGVQVVTADLQEPRSLAPALGGVAKVFLLGGFATADVLRRIRAAGAGHVVLLTSRCVSGGNPENAVTRMWLDAEAAVRDSGVKWTILRPSGFQSNALRWLPQLRAGDIVRAAWPAVPIAAIDPADIAAVASVVLTGPGHEDEALTLSGPEPLTPGEQVAALARALRRPLRYEPLSDDEARATMAADGTPASLIDAFFRFFSAGEFDDSAVTATVHDVTGRPPRTFEQWTQAHTGLFRSPAHRGPSSR